jgi:hypothetical protein
MKTLIIESKEHLLKSRMLELLQDEANTIVGIQDCYDALNLFHNEKFDMIIFGESLTLTECLYLVQTCHLQEKSVNRETPIKSLAKCNQTLKQIHRPNKHLSFFFSENALKRIQKSWQVGCQTKKDSNFGALPA